MKSRSKQRRNSVIRPGQRRPYRKGTRRQIRGRIRAMAELPRQGAGKMEIHRIVRKRFNVEWRQCDRYISWLTRARALDSRISPCH